MFGPTWLERLLWRSFASTAAPARPATGRRAGGGWVLGLFPNGDAAGTGVEALVQAGFSRRDISVMSPVPLPPNAYGLDAAKPKLWIPWATLAGGIIGACTGFLLAGGTAWLYPLNTGAKPIIALPPVGIITYELTMLFATLFTVVATLYNQYLPSYGPQPYAPEVSANGQFAVVIPCSSAEDVARAEQSLSRANASAVRRDPLVTL